MNKRKKSTKQKAKEDSKIFNRELPERYTVKLMYKWRNKSVLKINEEKLKIMEKKFISKKDRKKKVEYKSRTKIKDDKDQQRIEKNKKYLEELRDIEKEMGDSNDLYGEL